MQVIVWWKKSSWFLYWHIIWHRRYSIALNELCEWTSFTIISNAYCFTRGNRIISVNFKSASKLTLTLCALVHHYYTETVFNKSTRRSNVRCRVQTLPKTANGPALPCSNSTTYFVEDSYFVQLFKCPPFIANRLTILASISQINNTNVCSDIFR